MTAMFPTVVDIYAGNNVTTADFAAMHAYGIRGVIHKATEGRTLQDKKYRERLAIVRAEGMLFGAYHFANAGPVAAQVDNFLHAALPAGWDGKTLLALDWEDAPGIGTMSVDQAHDFCDRVFKATGQRPVIYSGNTAKRLLGTRVDAYLGAHRLWIPQYGLRPVLQASWKSYWLWQYTGDDKGPLYPHDIPGLRDDDLNVFGGIDLAYEWVGLPYKATPAAKPMPVVVNPLDKAPAPATPTWSVRARNWFWGH